MIHKMQDPCLENLSIVFFKKNGSFFTRFGSIEVEVIYNDTHWDFNWWKNEAVIKCSADWWCQTKDCDLDTLEYEEYCPQCPRELVVQIIEEAYTSDNHTFIEKPKNIEEVRLNILNEYQKLSHNGLHNQELYKVLYNTWVIK